MTLQMPEKKPDLPNSIQYENRTPQKRFLTSRGFKPDLNAIEIHVHNRLMKHNPSLLPYAREIQKDLLLLLCYMKLKRMSGTRSNESNLDGSSANQDEITRGFSSFLFFIRDTLARYNPEYHQEVRQIKNDVVGALRRIGMVKKLLNRFK